MNISQFLIQHLRLYFNCYGGTNFYVEKGLHKLFVLLPSKSRAKRHKL